MRNANLKICILALGIALLALPVMAERMEKDPAMAIWDIQGSDRVSGYTMTVQDANGAVRTFEFGAGEKVALLASQFEDGHYTYELTRNVLRGNTDRATAKAARRSGALESGAFMIENGQFVMNRPEAAAKDIQHNDDVLIFFSLCVGLDCVNGENFGADTIRLKENNLRMHFDDTSNSASFPANDWRITINDSINGGASYFSIDDATAGRQVFRVDAGAPANSLRVDSAGDVGIGESNPVVELHVQDGDSPTLRLEQDGSSGFDPQTYDIVSNEANFFIRDVTNGSQLPFRIKPGADTDSLFIAANNDIGVGTDAPAAAVHVKRSGTSVVSLQMSQAGGVNWSTRVTGGGQYRITDTDATGNDDGVNEFNLDGSGNLAITGTITTGGMTCGGGCDLVFSPDYELESIEEHAASMWKNSYLPQVGPTIENQPLDLTDKTGRMLNELEKAHIYIEQLNNTVKQLEQRLAELEAGKSE